MESRIEKYFSSLVILLFGLAAWPASALQNNDIRYTAYNIWKISARNMGFINYKFKTDFIPAGTRVIINDVSTGKDDYFDSDFDDSKYVTFTLADTGERYTLQFNEKYQRGTDFMDAANRTFTDKTFDELTEGFSEDELWAIRNGIVVAGMRKAAVLVSYGYPPSHRTPSLSSDTWNYWASRSGRFMVTFDTEGRANSNSHKQHAKRFHARRKPQDHQRSKQSLLSGDEIYERLKALDKMHHDGLLNDAEYEKKKQELIKKL
jgi:hypothetical protein